MNTDNSQEDFELIEHYLDGSLDNKMREEVQERILMDSNFAALVEEIRALQLGIERAALSSRLDSFHTQMAEQGKTVPARRLNQYQFWGIAASFFLAISAGVWLLLGQKSPGEELYLAYYRIDPGLVTSMSGEGNYNFDRAMVDYKSAEYSKAKEAFEALLKNNSQNDTLIYFLAMTELNLENNQTAEKLLDAVSQDDQSQFSKDANWYLGLILIKEGNYEAAIPYLNSSGRAEAEALMSELEIESGKL